MPIVPTLKAKVKPFQPDGKKPNHSQNSWQNPPKSSNPKFGTHQQNQPGKIKIFDHKSVCAFVDDDRYVSAAA